VESISHRPDVQHATCELRMTNGMLLDPLVLSNHIFNIRIGARLRGLEAKVDGWLERQNDILLLRLKGTNAMLRLSPTDRRVELDAGRKGPLSLTRRELLAYEELRKSVKPATRLRIIGPLLKPTANGPLVLQVREFEVRR
jgi:hypothetical protein